MQIWEYLYIFRWRGWKDRLDNECCHRATDCVVCICTKEEEKKWDGNLIDLLTKLGEESWELVSVCPRSDYLGGAHDISGYIEGTAMGSIKGKTVGQTSDCAGFTSSEMWVFKRPKP